RGDRDRDAQDDGHARFPIPLRSPPPVVRGPGAGTLPGATDPGRPYSTAGTRLVKPGHTPGAMTLRPDPARGETRDSGSEGADRDESRLDSPYKSRMICYTRSGSSRPTTAI